MGCFANRNTILASVLNSEAFINTVLAHKTSERTTQNERKEPL